MVMAQEPEKRPMIPRLSPEQLRNAPQYFGPGPEHAVHVEAGRPQLTTWQSFLEFDAEFNPLGKFGASFSSHL